MEVVFDGRSDSLGGLIETNVVYRDHLEETPFFSNSDAAQDSTACGSRQGSFSWWKKANMAGTKMTRMTSRRPVPSDWSKANNSGLKSGTTDIHEQRKRTELPVLSGTAGISHTTQRNST